MYKERQNKSEIGHQVVRQIIHSMLLQKECHLWYKLDGIQMIFI